MKKAEIKQCEEDKATELKRVEEREDTMSDEKEMERKVKESWRCQTGVRERGARTRPTQKERAEFEATRVPVVDLCTHLHDGQRKHQPPRHQTDRASDQSRRLTIAMDCYVVKMNSVVNAQTMSEK